MTCRNKSGACSDDELFLARQPILDRQQRVVAYELLFRSSSSNAAAFNDGARATAVVIVNTFSELSIGDALGDCRGFINVDEDMLFSDVLELLPRQAVVLEILETVRVTPEVVARCRTLRELGFSLALDDIVQLDSQYRPLFELIEIVKVEIPQIAKADLARLAKTIRGLGLKALAEKVDTREQVAHCMDLGFDLFQGYFFSKPAIIKGRKINPSQMTLMRLMNMVLADAETEELESVLKQEPGLILNLLRLTNSVAGGLKMRATSLRQVITVLGRRPLQRWLLLLLFAGGADPGHRPLLQMAAVRGRLLELLADVVARSDKGFADRALMIGILSLTPVMFDLPIEEIIATLTLPEDTRDALCERKGLLGELLSLAEYLEEDDFDGASNILSALPALSLTTVNRAQAMALAWANQIGQDN